MSKLETSSQAIADVLNFLSANSDSLDFLRDSVALDSKECEERLQKVAYASLIGEINNSIAHHQQTYNAIKSV